MKVIGISRGMETFIDDEDYHLVSMYRWFAIQKTVGKCWYAVTNIKVGNGKKKQVGMHQMVFPVLSGMMVDHIDRNGLNNQKKNLRAATALQNSINRGPDFDKRCPFKGVVWKRKSWQAGITYNGKYIYLGSYQDTIEAATAYDEAANRFHGEFAVLNFPNVDNSVPSFSKRFIEKIPVQ